MQNTLTYTEALDYIHSLKKFGSKLELNSIKKLLELMGNPEKNLNFIHIAGTNGKGSTTVFCANILSEAGYVTGTFISPHVLDFRERFQVNGKMITEVELAWIVSTIKPIAEDLLKENIVITEFEFITAIGFAFFIYKKCDIVCLEVGLGGKFDSTNVIEDPLACIITSISLDHTDRLGSSISEITEQKAGIIKENSKIICYPLIEKEAFDVIQKKCTEYKSVILIKTSIKSLNIVSTDILGSEFEYNGIEYIISLPGIHQIYNSITAIETIKSIQNLKLKQIKKLNKPKYINVKPLDIVNGLQKTTFPARFELISSEPNIILDGAHNIDGAIALSNILKIINKKKTIIFGVLKTKNCKEIIETISKCADNFICVDIKSNPDYLEKEKISKYFKQLGIECRIAKDYEDSINIAKYLSTLNDYIIICGSIYLISDIRKLLTYNF